MIAPDKKPIGDVVHEVKVKRVAKAIALVVSRKTLLDPEIAREMGKKPPEFAIADMAENMWPQLMEEAEAALKAATWSPVAA